VAELWTEEDIATLKAACASGILTVSYTGPPARSITYQDLETMRALLADMVRDVRGAPAFRRVEFSKGYRGRR
jgi:hypothetical protein